MEFIDIKQQISDLSIYDNIHILKLAKKIRDTIFLPNEKKIKIAVIGSNSIQYFVMVLRLFLLNYDIDAEIFEGVYNGINMAVFDKRSKLYQFQPKIIVILSNYRDIHDIPKLFSKKEEIDNFLFQVKSYYQELWNRISKITGCHIFQSNFVIPIERELGNIEANVYYSKRSLYNFINFKLIEDKPENVTIVDMEYIASFVGKENWFDYTLYFTSKIGYSMKYIGVVCDIYAQQIAALQGKIRKCLVLDLDNTLWGGVVADEGVNGINIDPNNGIGEAYRAFQQYVLDLKNRGVILAVASKNDYQVAKEPFEKNENMILKLDDFSIFIANWESKADNISTIARELNIGIDSLVFFDDNPAEREVVKMYYPEVLVIDVPENVAEYIPTLEFIHPFEWLNLTKEDIGRADSYKHNAEREKLNLQFQDYQDYLLALKMRGRVCYLEEKNIERFVQLINKSNQFNLRTQRYSVAQIEKLLHCDNYRLISVTLEDKFSKFGVISCIILRKYSEKCFIETWVMSCRVLKRDVEKFVLKKIVSIAREWRCKIIIGEYIPTSKNMLVKHLYSELDFVLLEEKENGAMIYGYNTENEPIQNFAIAEID